VYNLPFQLYKNQIIQQNGNTTNMLFSFEKIIAFVSKYITLKKGDLIFTGTPEGVGKVEIGDHLEGKLAGNTLLSFDIK
jgi:2-keto-4-pentenoate hydratase/2-oxohepta-3-ene-1,7-dioic acid hydratase in catechol pathway